MKKINEIEWYYYYYIYYYIEDITKSRNGQNETRKKELKLVCVGCFIKILEIWPFYLNNPSQLQCIPS